MRLSVCNLCCAGAFIYVPPSDRRREDHDRLDRLHEGTETCLRREMHFHGHGRALFDGGVGAVLRRDDIVAVFVRRVVARKRLGLARRGVHDVRIALFGEQQTVIRARERQDVRPFKVRIRIQIPGVLGDVAGSVEVHARRAAERGDGVLHAVALAPGRVAVGVCLVRGAVDVHRNDVRRLVLRPAALAVVGEAVGSAADGDERAVGHQVHPRGREVARAAFLAAAEHIRAGALFVNLIVCVQRLAVSGVARFHAHERLVRLLAVQRRRDVVIEIMSARRRVEVDVDDRVILVVHGQHIAESLFFRPGPLHLEVEHGIIGDLGLFGLLFLGLVRPAAGKSAAGESAAGESAAGETAARAAAAALCFARAGARKRKGVVRIQVQRQLERLLLDGHVRIPVGPVHRHEVEHGLVGIGLGALLRSAPCQHAQASRQQTAERERRQHLESFHILPPNH